MIAGVGCADALPLVPTPQLSPWVPALAPSTPDFGAVGLACCPCYCDSHWEWLRHVFKGVFWLLILPWESLVEALSVSDC